MSEPTLPLPPDGLLDPETFTAVVRLTAERTTRPEEFAALVADPVAARAWDAHERGRNQAASTFARHVRYTDAERMLRQPPHLGLRRGGQGVHYGPPMGARHVGMALAFGEIRRMGIEGSGAPVPPDVAERLGPNEVHLAGLAPEMSAVQGAMRRLRPGSPLPADVVMPLLADITRLEERLGRSALRRAIVPPAVTAGWGATMADAAVLAADGFPESFEAAYDGSWHTHKSSQTATGGFVAALRERVAREGGPAMLIVLAASSDGQNRGVAGVAGATPPTVYEKLIYDNSLGVLRQVVQSPQFNDARAMAMMRTDLGPQISAVMTHGRVNMGIRVLAAQRAITHDGVDPMHVYTFLQTHLGDAQVPHSLWLDYVREARRRLLRMREHGTPEQVEAYEKRLSRVQREFVADLLVPYCNAQEALAKAGGNIEALPYYQRRVVQENARFVEAHQFLKNEATLNLLVEGAATGTQMVDLLGHITRGGLPVPKALLLRVLRHDDKPVREAGMRLARGMNDAEVERLSRELEAEIEADYESIRNEVLTTVIPNYEDVEGTPRKLSRQRYHFHAARLLTLDQLTDIFTRHSAIDPRAIPDAMRRAADAVLASREAPSGDWGADLPAGPAVQEDLFGGISAPAPASGMMSASPVRPRRHRNPTP